MAKSLYSALFDWIVFRINHALLNIKDLVETTKVWWHKTLTVLGFCWITVTNVSKESFFNHCIISRMKYLVALVASPRSCPSECSTFLVLKITKTTALSSSASTSPMNVSSTTSTSTSSSLNRQDTRLPCRPRTGTIWSYMQCFGLQAEIVS